MLKHLALLCLCGLLSAQNISAQTTQPPIPHRHQLGLNIGLSFLRSKDDLASPFTYNGTGLPRGITYTNQHTEALILFDHAHLTTPITQSNTPRINAYRLRTRITHHRFWHTLYQSRIQVFGGGALDAFLTTRSLTYRQNVNEPFGELTSTFHPSIKLLYNHTSQTSITYEVSIPVLTLILRNPHSIKGPLNVRLTSLNNFLSIDHRLTYSKRLSPQWGLRLIYWGQYYRYTKPRTTQMGIDQLSATLYWAF